VALAATSASRADELGCAPAQPGWGTPRQDLAVEVLERLNAFRAASGVAPVSASPSLQRAALWKSGHMLAAAYFQHADPPVGRSPADRATVCGYVGPVLGENIAEGQRDPAAVMQAWANSPGHRAAMLDPDYTAVGIGVAQRGDGRLYWTQDFGAPAAAEPVPPAPVPVADQLSVPQGAAAQLVPVLANDGVDPGDAARVIWVGSAQLGSVEKVDDGAALRYVPVQGRFGADRVTYTVVGLMGAVATGELLVEIERPNEPPQAADDRVVMGRRARRVAIRVLANDRDTGAEPLRIQIVGRPRHGRARVRAGRIVYTARRPGRLRDRLRYAAIDVEGLSSVATVTVIRRARARPGR